MRPLLSRLAIVCLLAPTLLLSLFPGIAQGAGASPQPTRLTVVATFSVLGDITARIGGDRIELHVLVGPDSDGHLYQPTPADSRLLRQADLIISNGLGFEGWIERLVLAAKYQGEAITASTGIKPLYSGEGRPREPDPHAWQDIANIKQYVNNISQALQRLSPRHQAFFESREVAYLAELDALERQLQEALGTLPAQARSIVTSHDAFRYFGEAYQLRFLSPLGLNTDSEASARDVANLIRQIRHENIRAVFVENITDARLLERITSETGARIGGTLYSDALSPAEGPAPTYLAMMRHNLRTIMAALAQDTEEEKHHD